MQEEFAMARSRALLAAFLVSAPALAAQESLLAPARRMFPLKDNAQYNGDAFAAGDLDQDGFDDVPVGTLGSILFWRGSAVGRFVDAGTLAPAGTPSAIELLDVEADGDL